MLINIIEDYEIDLTRKNRSNIFGYLKKRISLSIIFVNHGHEQWRHKHQGCSKKKINFI